MSGDPAGVISLKDLAAEIGVYRSTVGDLVHRHQIPTHPMGHPRAKGLDRKGVAKVMKLLNVQGPAVFA